MPTIGIDYASIDGNARPNFDAAYQAGARFAIPRAIFGRPITPGSKKPYVDPVWARDRDAIVAAGLRRTAYIFMCFPRKGLYTPTPEEQAQAYIDYVQLTPNRDLVPMFDVEEESNVLTADAMFDWTLRMCQKLRDHYGTWPGMYTSSRVWKENLNSHMPGALVNCPLWLCKPWPWAINTPAHLDGAPSYNPSYIPLWGNACAIYQYQGDATGFPGFNKTVDVNRFETMKRGAKGKQVEWIQKRLGVTVDGDFGPKTETAVKELQAKHGLVVDGIIGVNTFAPLCWLNPVS